MEYYPWTESLQAPSEQEMHNKKFSTMQCLHADMQIS